MLQALLEKLGIKNIDDLKPAERATYIQWAKVLEKGEITIDDLKILLPKELDRAHQELRGFDNSAEKDLFYKAYAELCSNIMKIILAPAKERDNLKSMLKKKFNIDEKGRLSKHQHFHDSKSKENLDRILRRGAGSLKTRRHRFPHKARRSYLTASDLERYLKVLVPELIRRIAIRAAGGTRKEEVNSLSTPCAISGAS